MSARTAAKTSSSAARAPAARAGQRVEVAVDAETARPRARAARSCRPVRCCGRGLEVGRERRRRALGCRARHDADLRRGEDQVVPYLSVPSASLTTCSMHERCHVGNGPHAPGGLRRARRASVAQELGHGRRLAQPPDRGCPAPALVSLRASTGAKRRSRGARGVADRVEARILELLDAEIARWAVGRRDARRAARRAAHARRRRRQAAAARVLPLRVRRRGGDPTDDRGDRRRRPRSSSCTRSRSCTTT